MTTLDDLRASLADHADIPDDALTARADAVHNRVRRVRRQRRATLAGGLAAALVVAGLGASLLPNAHRGAIQPAGIPGTVAVDGFDYHFDHAEITQRGAHRLVVKLPKSTDRRAVMLVGTGLGSGTATLREEDQNAQRLMHDGTEPAFAVGSDADEFTVTLAGTPATAKVSLAIYTRTPGRPVYRQQIENRTLIGDDTDRNASTLTFTFTSPGGQVGWATTCHAPGLTRPKVWFAIDGKDEWEGDCNDPGLSEDVAGNTDWSSWHLPAGRHTATLHVVARGNAAPAVVPGAVLSLGAYAVAYDRGKDLLGASVPSVTEYYGRMYAPDPTVVRQATITPTEPVLVTLIGARGMSHVVVTTNGREDDEGTWNDNETADHGWGIEEVLLPGQTYHLRIGYGRTAAHDGAILLFRPVTP